MLLLVTLKDPIERGLKEYIHINQKSKQNVTLKDPDRKGTERGLSNYTLKVVFGRIVTLKDPIEGD